MPEQAHDLAVELARAQALTALAVADLPAGELVELALQALAAAGIDARYAPAADGGVPVLVDGRQVGALLAQPAPYVQQVADVLGTALTRDARLRRLLRREQHFEAAQRISHVGSYDFEIASNTNDWSDQLYRIYGRDPGSLMATYERFLEMVHPDDREQILAVHGQALAEVSSYEMEERVVWPDGQVRTLASWGEVVPDASGAPARMVGICWDITEQKKTAAALQRSSERFRQLIQSAPDVVLVTSADGVVLQASACLVRVLGWEPDDLVGRPVTDVVPDGLLAGERVARGRTGDDILVDLTASTFASDEGEVTIAFLRDVSDRQRAEALALRLHDDDVRRRHALQINDNVVQGLTSVLYLLDLDRQQAAHAAARHTLDAARQMMSDLLVSAGPTLLPGELVRDEAHVGTLGEAVEAPPPPAPGALRVLLVDDAEDIRLLLRLNLNSDSRFDVVGQAEDGEQAVRLARELQPDVVVLDLSMPVLDGLQATPLLLEACPGVRIVVLSGFDEDRMKQAALEAGAHAYLEKGNALSQLVEALVALFPERGLTQPAALEDPAAPGTLSFDGDMVVHELRTPLTVITGMLATLRDRADVLPSATTHELVMAALRNSQQMADLLEVLSDARRAFDGRLPIVPERVDVGEVVAGVVADLCAAHGWGPAPVAAAEGATAHVDPVRLRQILANLLRNAYTFGSSVLVRVEVVGDAVEVAVVDDGPGLPAGRRSELFEKFSRLGRTGSGMGLGLYISRALARAHRGDLVLADGSPTTFVLRLPLAQPVPLPGG